MKNSPDCKYFCVICKKVFYIFVITTYKGAKVFTKANEYVHKGFQVDEIKSIGAWDGFSAGFIGIY